MSLWRNFFGPPCIAVRTETAGERSCLHLRGIYKTNKNSFPMVYDICVDFPPFSLLDEIVLRQGAENFRD